jgi:hypothetical protein
LAIGYVFGLPLLAPFAGDLFMVARRKFLTKKDAPMI